VGRGRDGTDSSEPIRIRLPSVSLSGQPEYISSQSDRASVQRWQALTAQIVWTCRIAAGPWDARL